MKHLVKITDYKVNIEKLKSVYFDIIEKLIEWSKDDPNLYDFNAICVNQIPNDSLSIRGGNIRGLYWTYPKSDWKEEQRLNKVNEYKYTQLCKPFKNTYVEDVYNEVSAKWKIGRFRFLMKPPRSCLSWHRDPEKRLHIPIITNPGCRMVIEDESFHMPADGSVYITDNTKYHNFFNGGEVDRIHLVGTLLEK
tara:strand:+ start:529 stop:1107 length:579 start_codon:yes stop_codon:yes gene_type:complete